MSKISSSLEKKLLIDIFVFKILKIKTPMRREVKNEDSRPLDQTQTTSINSSCHIGIQ